MKPPDKTKWSCRWQKHELETISRIADSIPRQQNMSDLSRWRAAESLYHDPSYGYLRSRRLKK